MSSAGGAPWRLPNWAAPRAGLQSLQPVELEQIAATVALALVRFREKDLSRRLT